MGLEFSFMQMGIDTRENGETKSLMERGSFILLMDLDMKEIF